MQQIKRVLPLALMCWFMGCATIGNYPGPSDYPAKWEWSLVESKNAPAVAQFQKLFFNAPDMNEALRTQLAQMLLDHPNNGHLHDMAAHLNELDGRPDKSWWHWAQASEI